MYKKINYQDYLKIKDDAIIIDVKDKIEYLNNHLDGAINIPINNIVSVINIVKDKYKKIVIYCSNGKRSYIACKSLLNLGYKNVYDLYLK